MEEMEQMEADGTYAESLPFNDRMETEEHMQRIPYAG